MAQNGDTMHALAGIAAALATPTPSPSPTGVDPNLVTPGPWGFVAIAFIAIAVILLVWDMLRRIRRARYREEVGAQLDEESAALLESDDSEDTSDPEPPAKT